MWFAITAAIVFTILIFSFGKNRKHSRYGKEGKNNSSDPGSDADSSSNSDSGGSFGGSGSGSSW
jgi:uncharacterized membrane protein YgcG